MGKDDPAPIPYRFKVIAAARYLGMGTTTLQEKTYAGLIPSHKDGHARYWLRSDLEAYADAQARDAATEAEPTPLRKVV